MRPERQLGFLWGGVAATLLLASPWADRLAATLPGCPFLRLTGLPCPGCGSTRAAVALARLEPFEALAHNPLATAGWVLLVAGGAVAGLAAFAGRGVPEIRRSPPGAVRWLAAAAVVLNWLYLGRFAP